MNSKWPDNSNEGSHVGCFWHNEISENYRKRHIDDVIIPRNFADARIWCYLLWDLQSPRKTFQKVSAMVYFLHFETPSDTGWIPTWRWCMIFSSLMVCVISSSLMVGRCYIICQITIAIIKQKYHTLYLIHISFIILYVMCATLEQWSR